MTIHSQSAIGMRCPSLAELPPPPAGRTGWPWTVETPPSPPAMPDGKPWPLISIVTPSYNQFRFLEETLRSILLQGYPNLEYIVMDGGSTDGSLEILHKYAPWFSYWQSERDGGQAAAIASGFQRAQGDIMAWLNSDDIYTPGALVRVARFFAARPRTVFGNGDTNVIDQDGRFIYRITAVHPVPRVTATLGNHSWPQQGCFWRRTAYERVGGVDASLRFCMDRDLFLRLTHAGHSQRIPGPSIAAFRTHEEAKTTLIQDVWAQEDQMLKQRYASRFGRNPLYRRLLLAIWHVRQFECGVRRRCNLMGINI